jgi:hypothetical protein
MSWISDLLKEVLVSEPQDESKLPQMSPKQEYDYLVSSRKLTPWQQARVEVLHKALGKDKWD